MRKIMLLEDVDMYMTIIREGITLKENKPYQGFNDDGTFTICQGMGVYKTIEKSKFKEI